MGIFYDTQWQITDTNSGAIIVGEGIRGGVGRLRMDIMGPNGEEHMIDAWGLGGGIGVGLRMPGGIAYEEVLEVLEAIRGISSAFINFVGAQDFYMSHIYRVGGSTMTFQELVRNSILVMISTSGTCGLGISGNLIFFLDPALFSRVSPLLATFPAAISVAIKYVAAVAGFELGLVDIGITELTMAIVDYA